MIFTCIGRGVTTPMDVVQWREKSIYVFFAGKKIQRGGNVTVWKHGLNREMNTGIKSI